MKNMVVVNTAMYFILVLNSEDIFKLELLDQCEILRRHYQDSTFGDFYDQL